MIVSICVIARDEQRYIKEFVDYHLFVGFDKIYLYDNNDESDDSMHDILIPYGNDGRVRYKKCSEHDQLWAFQDYADHHAGESDWTLYCDVDEYLTLSDQYASVAEYLSSDIVKGADAVRVNWLVFGSNGKIKKEDGLIQERFPCPFSYNEIMNRHVKSFIRSAAKTKPEWSVDSHLTNNDEWTIVNADGVAVKNKPFLKFTSENAYLRHYYTKSLEEYVEHKMKQQKKGFTSGQGHSLARYHRLNRFELNRDYVLPKTVRDFIAAYR